MLYSFFEAKQSNNLGLYNCLKVVSYVLKKNINYNISITMREKNTNCCHVKILFTMRDR